MPALGPPRARISRRAPMLKLKHCDKQKNQTQFKEARSGAYPMSLQRQIRWQWRYSQGVTRREQRSGNRPGRLPITIVTAIVSPKGAAPSRALPRRKCRALKALQHSQPRDFPSTRWRPSGKGRFALDFREPRETLRAKSRCMNSGQSWIAR